MANLTGDNATQSSVESVRPYEYGQTLSVSRYDELARAGVLDGEDKLELIEGALSRKMTKNERHLTTCWLLEAAIRAVVPADWFVVVESPIMLARSEPEPDVSVLRGNVRRYFGRKPSPSDVALVIEVSDTSYAQDLARRSMYAEAGISTYWIANVPAQRIEVYSEPALSDGKPEYAARDEYGTTEFVPLVLDGTVVATIAVCELLSPYP